MEFTCLKPFECVRIDSPACHNVRGGMMACKVDLESTFFAVVAKALRCIRHVHVGQAYVDDRTHTSTNFNYVLNRLYILCAYLTYANKAMSPRWESASAKYDSWENGQPSRVFN